MEIAPANYCIANAQIVDGSGGRPFVGDVEITGDVISGIAPAGRGKGEQRFDVNGMYLSPGFIDIHSHADYTLLVDGSAESALLQGVTSVVTGNCGHGVAPCPSCARDMMATNIFGWRRDTEIDESWESFGDYTDCLRRRGVGVNVFPLVAHGALRIALSGFEQRALTASEKASMRSMVCEALQAGAVGFSTGLEYAPGIAADFDELATASEPLGDFHALYATHCRNRTDAMAEAAIESAEIAKRAGSRLQLSHFLRRPYGPRECDKRAWDALSRFESDGLVVRSDVFPFDYGPTPLAVLLPLHVRTGSRLEIAGRLEVPQIKARILNELSGMFGRAVEAGLAESMYVACDGTRGGELVGRTLGDIARDQDISVAEAALWLLSRAQEDFYSVMIVERWVEEADLRAALRDPRYFIMSDGVVASQNGRFHSSGFSLSDWGYVPAYLGRYVRDFGLVSLEDAVAKMTRAPADQIGLSDRGRIAEGQKADLVLFDYDALETSVAPDNLTCTPRGISQVFVNGVWAVKDGTITGARPGTVGIARY